MKLRKLRLRLDVLEDRTVPAAGDVDWLRQFGSLMGAIPGDPARAVVVSGGNVYLAGDGPGQLPYVRKYDASGNMLWTREFVTNSTLDRGIGIAADDSGVYVVGQMVVPLPADFGNIDGFVRKLDLDGNELWIRQFGTFNAFGLSAADAATGVAVDASGVYVVGYTGGALPGQSSSGGVDAFMRKYDANGSELWTQQFGGRNSFGIRTGSTAQGVAVDASGVYVAGVVNGSFPGQTNTGSSDAFLRKFNSAGNELWTRQFGTASGDTAVGVSVEGSAVYVAGTIGGGLALPGQSSAGGNDSFVRKYDAGGQELWTRQFGSDSDFDGATSVFANDSGVYVGGYAGEPGQTGSAGWWDASVRKFDAAGTAVWTRQLGGFRSDGALGVAGDASGVYVVGYTESALPGGGGGILGVMDSFVRKYDIGGTIAWTRQFGPRYPAVDAARAVDADGNVYVVGTVGGFLPDQQSSSWGGFANGSDSDAFVRKYDAAGNELWTRQFSAGVLAFNGAFALAVDATGVYVAGAVEEHVPGVANPAGQEAFVRKFDASGNELWVCQLGTTGTESANGIAADATGVYVTGSTTGTFPGQTSAGGQDAFVRKYDSAGGVLWTSQFGSSDADQAVAIAVDASGVWVSGTTGGSLPGQTSAGGQDGFVRRYDAGGTVLWTRQFGTPAADSATGVAADDSGVCVSGATAGTFAGQTSAGGIDAFVLKHDISGGQLWTRQFGSADSDRANGVAVGGSGVYVAGETGGTLPGQASAGDQDAFVGRFDSGGNPIWTRQFGTVGADSVAGVAASAAGLFVAGTTTGAFPGLSNPGSPDVFVAKIVDDVVINTSPSNVALNLNATVSEGGTATLTGSFTDPDATDTHTVVINWGPGEGTATLNLAAGVTTFSATHTYSDDNPTGTAFDIYIVSATVTEPAGGSAGGNAAVTINNVAPAVTITGPPSGVFTVGTPVALTGSFTDSGTGDTHTAQWTIGADTLGGSLTQGSGSGTVADSYAFSAAGVYSIHLSVTDDDGGSGSDEVSIMVVGRPTTMALSVSSATPLLGVDSVTISAAVSAVSGTPTGSVTFYDGTSILGTINLVDGVASLTLGPADLTPGSHTIRAVYSGDPGFAGSESGATINVLAPSTVQGLVYVDFNDDGLVDFGERAVADVAIALTGTDDVGNAVSRSVRTDVNGIYAFANLRPSNSVGYSITESQPAGLLDGRETPGTVNGAPTGSAASNDTFSGVVLAQGGLFAENYNFGERPTTSGGVVAGQTATIGFWQNNNGQALVTSLNGGASATQLGHWLALSFPNLYAALDGQTNAQVAAHYKTLFARTAHDAPAGPPKVDAQVMATALAVYVTNQTLAGTTAAAFGFQVTANGVGIHTFNVAGNGTAFGVANNSEVSVLDLLLAINAQSHNGLLYDQNSDGQISSAEAASRTMVNVVFTGINEAGDI